MRVLRVAVVIFLGYVSATFAFGPITFSSAADYDNTKNTVTNGPTTVYNQTTGLFRDTIWWSLNNGLPRVGSGDYINRGQNLVMVGNQATNNNTGLYTALNFNGPAISGGQSYMSVYDTTPADGTATKNLFDASAQTLTISADVMFTIHSVSAGVFALYNEGQDGLALLASNGGGNNPDVPKVSLVWQSAGKGTNLTTISLPGTTFTITNWYRVTMNLSVAGDAWTMNGNFRTHSIGTDPTSALGSVITNLSFTGSLSDPDFSSRNLTNPGEIGLVAVGNESISLPDSVGVSFTNFEAVPEPTSISLLGLSLGLGGILAAFSARRRKRA